MEPLVIACAHVEQQDMCKAKCVSFLAYKVIGTTGDHLWTGGTARRARQSEHCVVPAKQVPGLPDFPCRSSSAREGRQHEIVHALALFQFL
eukprot:324502-Pelagomonas_calceolata.AAC.4